MIRASVVLLCLTLAACGGSDRSSPTSPSTTPSANAAFILQGDPESAQGATWTYKGLLDGVTFDLQGILFKPAGAGPFGAVVISHGAGGNVSSLPRTLAMEMRQWGLVGIATNYTHSGGVPIGAPGTANDPGASDANIQRAHAVREILRTLTYVDQTKVAAHGHSMGAFVTTALVATYPNDFRVASHTAGGIRLPGIIAGPAPSESQARLIRTPYQMHHGDQDTVVPLSQEQRLDAVLQTTGTQHELFVYPGADHLDVPTDPTVLARIRSWYASHQVP